MTGTATLNADGSTRYETDSLTEFAEAIAAAREETADIQVRSEGNGTFVAHIRYPEDSSESNEAASEEPPVKRGRGKAAEDAPPPTEGDDLL